MVRSGRIHQLVKGAGTFGTRTGQVTLDWEAIVRRQHEVVRALQPSPGAFEKMGAKVHLAEARFVDPRTVQPIHYGTFPVLRGTPDEYIKALGRTTTQIFPINPGDSLKF